MDHKKAQITTSRDIAYALKPPSIRSGENSKPLQKILGENEKTNVAG